MSASGFVPAESIVTRVEPVSFCDAQLTTGLEVKKGLDVGICTRLLTEWVYFCMEAAQTGARIGVQSRHGCCIQASRVHDRGTWTDERVCALRLSSAVQSRDSTISGSRFTEPSPSRPLHLRRNDAQRPAAPGGVDPPEFQIPPPPGLPVPEPKSNSCKVTAS
ncbi:hypothetical protein N7539_008418 [Penicillium diatomitis]|uniref:Uncharacterized protein n=1 Tax=Penicillium diatomitis TaxID=2819901 RepID=A0A9W9WTQ5_9EURO|nr:uncharacterized protein N7539_008418 [Penicillium diatomitis]KAJ5475352.1 hypothetical protein N7539_008418 [Penicillium diatomitis]